MSDEMQLLPDEPRQQVVERPDQVVLGILEELEDFVRAARNAFGEGKAEVAYEQMRLLLFGAVHVLDAFQPGIVKIPLPDWSEAIAVFDDGHEEKWNQ